MVNFSFNVYIKTISAKKMKTFNKLELITFKPIAIKMCPSIVMV